MKYFFWGGKKNDLDYLKEPIDKLGSKKEMIYFYDKYVDFGEKYCGVTVIKDIWEKFTARKDQIIITSSAWHSVYSECVAYGVLDALIFDRDDCTFKSYGNMCRDHYSYFQNHLSMISDFMEDIEKKRAYQNFKKSNEILGNVQNVAIMISNLCNLSYCHQKCPAHSVKKREIFATDKIRQVYQELSEIGYKGKLHFHIYNEPMIDPRLFLLIKEAKKVMPDVRVCLYTNGFCLDETIINDLYELQVDYLTVTGYGEEEYLRLMDLDINIPYYVLGGNLDERLDWYDNANSAVCKEKRCGGFIHAVNIFSNGDVGICCLDYKHPYNIGNVYNETLREIMSKTEVVEFQKKLLVGDRTTFTLCKNCGWSLY